MKTLHRLPLMLVHQHQWLSSARLFAHSILSVHECCFLTKIDYLREIPRKEIICIH